jgi:hypothetical protein
MGLSIPLFGNCVASEGASFCTCMCRDLHTFESFVTAVVTYCGGEVQIKFNDRIRTDYWEASSSRMGVKKWPQRSDVDLQFSTTAPRTLPRCGARSLRCDT